MLTITISGKEHFDLVTGKFIREEGTVLELEHSLAVLSKWESKHEKPFLSGKPIESEELLSYIQCMIITPGVNPQILSGLSQENLNEIDRYINAKETATTFSMLPERKGRKEIVTAEVIYHLMVAFNIPESWEHRHLNQLLTFIRVCNAKNPNNKQKKLSKAELAARHRELNAKRRQETGSKG